jgi:hypothetical protein
MFKSKWVLHLNTLESKHYLTVHFWLSIHNGLDGYYVMREEIDYIEKIKEELT